MPCDDLTLLCVTKGEPFAARFIARMGFLGRLIGAQVHIAIDGPPCPAALEATLFAADRMRCVASQGYIESVLDDVVSTCETNYIFRLDDDERCSESLVEWLANSRYREETHWKFPRAHVWRDANTFINASPLWPDFQTRLSTRERSGGRRTVHAGSPYGGGTPCPYYIEHWKFMVKSFEERKAIAVRYDAVQEGFGTGGMLAFSLPELAIPDLEVHLQPLRDEVNV